MTQPTHITRRNLLRLGTLAATGSLMTRFQPAMAGPFVGTDFDKLVPADKKLSAAWLRSLTERGEPEWLGGEDLHHIGMPVGGICCGQVYLSGDGRLWHWDIFNQGVATDTGGSHYAKPMPVASVVDLGFQVRVDGVTRSLDRTGFPQVRFRGAYPLGFVDFRDDALPVKISLEAFSPFVPLDVDGSSLPLTVMRYTLRNPSASQVEVSLAGSLVNPVLIHSGLHPEIEIVNRIVKRKSATCLHCAAEKTTVTEVGNPRPEIVFDDFEAGNYDNWTVEGTAFGAGTVEAAKMPAYQGNVGAHGGRLVNSHHTRNGEDPAAADAHTGTLTSKTFKIERRFIHLLIGGGIAAGGGVIELLVGDKVVATASGQNQNVMTRRSFNVAEQEGQEARLRIVDKGTQGWGNIGVDYIVFSDVPSAPADSIDSQADMGEMTLAILGDAAGVFCSPGSADFSPSGWVGDAETTKKS